MQLVPQVPALCGLRAVGIFCCLALDLPQNRRLCAKAKSTGSRLIFM